MANIPVQQARKVFTTVLANMFQDFIEAPSFLRGFAKEKVYSTKTVQSMARRGTEKVAVDIIRGAKGNLNQMTKFTQKEFLPPYYNEITNVTAMDIYDIPFTSGDAYSVAQIDKLAMEVAQTMSEDKKKIDRAIELQCAQYMETGVVELKSGDNIDYKRQSTMIEQLAGTELWDSTSVDIIKFFEDKGHKLRTIGKISGGTIVDCIIGADAWAAFRKNTTIMSNENMFYEVVMDMQASKIMGTGGTYNGTINAKGYKFRLWTYDEVYDNASNVSTRYLNPKIVHLIPQSFEAEISFAQVPMLPSWINTVPTSKRAFSTLGNKMKGFAIRDWVNEDEESYFAGIKAAPLAQMVSVDRMYTALVLAAD